MVLLYPAEGIALRMFLDIDCLPIDGDALQYVVTVHRAVADRPARIRQLGGCACRDRPVRHRCRYLEIEAHSYCIRCLRPSICRYRRCIADRSGTGCAEPGGQVMTAFLFTLQRDGIAFSIERSVTDITKAQLYGLSADGTIEFRCHIVTG